IYNNLKSKILFGRLSQITRQASTRKAETCAITSWQKVCPEADWTTEGDGGRGGEGGARKPWVVGVCRSNRDLFHLLKPFLRSYFSLALQPSTTDPQPTPSLEGTQTSLKSFFNKHIKFEQRLNQLPIFIAFRTRGGTTKTNFEFLS
ncbi:hypothetical protein V1478_017306, partial [Vespula squamosa]